MEIEITETGVKGIIQFFGAKYILLNAGLQELYVCRGKIGYSDTVNVFKNAAEKHTTLLTAIIIATELSNFIDFVENHFDAWFKSDGRENICIHTALIKATVAPLGDDINIFENVKYFVTKYINISEYSNFIANRITLCNKIFSNKFISISRNITLTNIDDNHVRGAFM
jgi:hypothetical protein